MRGLLCWLVAMAALLGAPVARAEGVAAPCTAQTSLATGFAAVTAGAVTSDCTHNRWSIAGPRSWLLFDRSAIARTGAGPLEITVRAARFDRIALFVRYADGATVSQVRNGDDAMPWRMAGPIFVLAVPPHAARPELIAIAVDRPGFRPTMTAARLERAGMGGWSYKAMLLMAGFVGLALTPLVFNLSFYRVLRERFLLWHMALACCIFAYTLMSSGLIFGIFPQMGNRFYGYVSQATFSLGIVAASMFARHFIEPDKLFSADRRALIATAIWIPIFTAIAMAPFEFVRPWGSPFYFAAYVPVLLTYIVVIARAWRRGSRAARFQAFSWAPIVLCGLERIVRGVGFYPGTELLDQLLYLAIALELIITTLGVADRFTILRSESDLAHARADAMADVAATDPLTGLVNRRGLEQMLASGGRRFTGAALIDIDRFKTINDLYGHQVGDAVLCAIAEALDMTGIGVVARIGGEEFFLLIEKHDTAASAEAARQAIGTDIASNGPAVGHPVTASGGLLTFDTALSGEMLDFDRLYADTDRLLYAAKHSGRDCMVTDRWTAPRVSPDPVVLGAAA